MRIVFRTAAALALLVLTATPGAAAPLMPASDQPILESIIAHPKCKAVMCLPVFRI